MTLRRVMAPTLVATHSSGLVLDVSAASITLDEAQAPYAAAQLTCAVPPGDRLELLDPRQAQRVVIQLDDHADLFGQTPDRRRLDLGLVSMQSGTVAGELVLNLASDESQLIGQVLLLANVKDWNAGTAGQLVRNVLAFLGYSITVLADMNIDPAAAVQSPGDSFWDFLDGTLQGGNLRLWCDETRVWRLQDKSDPAGGQLSLDYAGTVTGLNDSIGQDALYADSLVVRYSYLDASGNAQTSYEYAGDATSRRGRRIDFSSAPAAKGTARRLLKRLQGRGHVLTHEAVARYSVSPLQAFLATLPDGQPVQSGIVSAVTWRIPDDRMDIRSRELTDTPSSSWAAQPTGRSWASVPVGVSWAQVDAVPWSAIGAGKSWSSVPAGWRWNEMKGYTYG